MSFIKQLVGLWTSMTPEEHSYVFLGVAGVLLIFIAVYRA